MKNKIDAMLLNYGLNDADNIYSVLNELTEAEARNYCWQILQSYSDLKKEDWIIGIEGGDYIYSFDGSFAFITDDIWGFDLRAEQKVLETLKEKIQEIMVIE